MTLSSSWDLWRLIRRRRTHSEWETLKLLLVSHFRYWVFTEELAAAARCAKYLDWRVAASVVTYR